MKYNSKNPPLVCMQTTSTCYKGTTKLPKIKGVLWHSTGANNPNLKRYVQPSNDAPNRKQMLALLGTNANRNDWNHIVRYAGMNAWIGKLADGTVAAVQTMPWDFKPWGCGTGYKGSCNDGWLQFEICEDGLNNKSYFDKVYKEACELTAYLCTMFGLDPHGTVEHKGVKVPVILCHQDSYKLGLGGNHADIYHWFPKYGKNMETVRDDVAALMKTSTSAPTPPPIPTPAEKKTFYRVRKNWADSKSQIGAYTALKNAEEACDKAGKGYFVFDENGVAVYPKEQVVIKPSTPSTNKGTQARDLAKLSKAEIVAKVGPLFTADQEKTGVLAAISMAQFLLESGYASSELAIEANNCFGMKTSLSGNTWSGSTWKGEVYNKETKEWEADKQAYRTITAPFRKYDNIEDSIEDHSAYLLGAKKGSGLRYAGLKNETDYKKAAQLIKDGGYATSPTYVKGLCDVIEDWNLTKYNAKENPKVEEIVKEEEKVTNGLKLGDEVKLVPGAKYISGKTIPAWVFNNKLYVRGISGDNITFSTLKTGAITGVTHKSNLQGFENNTPKVEEEKPFVAYTVKITANVLNVRAGAGVQYPINTTVRKDGVYTIVAEENGWGQLKSGAGWINLKYGKRV